MAVSTEAIGAGISAGVNTAGFIAFLILILLAIVGFIAFVIYRKSFNIDIILTRFGTGPDFRTGFKGKMYLTGKSNEYRFKIWNAKKHKLLYNKEAINPEDIYQHEDATKKVKQLLFLGYNSEGYLVPLRLTPEEYLYQKNEYDASGKIIGTKTYKTNVIKSQYQQVDVAWFATETEKWKNLFRPIDNNQMWMLIVVAVVVVLALGAFMYNSHLTAKATENFAGAAKTIADAVTLLANNGTMPVGTAAQPLNTVIIS